VDDRSPEPFVVDIEIVSSEPGKGLNLESRYEG
jgi:hypothetical protein